MHNHSIRVFPAPSSLRSYPGQSHGRQSAQNEEKKEAPVAIDEDIIVRLNMIASKHPFCRYRKVKSHDPL